MNKARDLRNAVDGIDMDGIKTLLDMAINGKIPDGTFSDFECNVWSEMRCVLRKNNIAFNDK